MDKNIDNIEENSLIQRSGDVTNVNLLVNPHNIV